MTKPKKIKPVRPVPVLAWALCDKDGIMLREIGRPESVLRWIAGLGWNQPRRVIRERRKAGRKS